MRILLALALITRCLPYAEWTHDGATRQGDGGVAVLFIGNSLTYWNRLPEVLAGLFDDAAVPRGRFETVAFPDFGLQDHWGRGPRGPARSAIAEAAWDVIVLQQGPSATQGRPSLLRYAELFAAEIRAVGAVPALYMVWPAREREFDFDGVSDSYRQAARRVDGLLFPAGEAWREAWNADPEVDLYGPDGFHPSTLGTYLAALVMFEQLTGRDPRTLPAPFRTPNATVELPIGAASLLQEAAAEANERFARSPGSAAQVVVRTRAR